MTNEELKYNLLNNLEPIMSRVNHNGNSIQYVTINSSYDDSFSGNKFYLIVEVMTKLLFDNSDFKLKIASAKVENFFFFKNDGADVNNFKILKSDIDKELIIYN